MGFTEQSNKKIYCGISEGRISFKIGEGQFEYHGGLNGTITDLIYRPDGKFGPELLVILFDEKDEYQLQMRSTSGYAKAFLKQLPNINLAAPVTLVPSYKMKEGKQFAETSMFVQQKNELGKWTALKWAYTVDNPNGLPPAEKVKVKQNGRMEDGWDYDKQMEFLLKMMHEIKPLLPASKVMQRNTNVASVTQPQGAEVYVAPVGADGNADDLPF